MVESCGVASKSQTGRPKKITSESSRFLGSTADIAEAKVGPIAAAARDLKVVVGGHRDGFHVQPKDPDALQSLRKVFSSFEVGVVELGRR